MNDRLISRKEATARTGFSLDQLKDLTRRGLLRMLWINQRVCRIPEADLADLPAKIQELNAKEAMNQLDSKTQLDRETSEGLKKIFGYIPGVKIQ